MSISNFHSYVNFILLQSCQFQTSTVMSISNSCSHVKSISIYIHDAVCYMFGQVASSHPRTACACQFAFIFGQVTSSNTRTACACALCLLSAERPVQIQEQLVLPTLRLSSAKRPVRTQEQLVLVYLLVSPVKFPVRAKRTTCTCQSAIDLPSESCYLWSCQCLPIPQWIRHVLLKLNSQSILHS